MEAKEKAKELVLKYLKVARITDENNLSSSEALLYNGKECALIAVELVIENEKVDALENNNLQYWNEVKQEIEKL